MKRLWYVLILVFASVSHAALPKAVLCSTELSREARGVINLVVGALERADIEAADVSQFLAGLADSPFALDPRGLRTFNSANRFRGTYARLDERGRDQVQVTLQAVLKTKAVEAQAIAEIREETKLVLAPRLEQMRSPFPTMNQSGDLVQGKWNGRPVFTGTFQGDGTWYILIDPTNPVEGQRIVRLGTNNVQSIGSQSPLPSAVKSLWISLHEKNYVAFLGNGDMFEMESLTPVPLSKIGLDDLSGQKVFDLPALLNTPQGLMLYVLMRADSSLREYNLSQPELPARILPVESPRHLRFHEAGGRHFVTYETFDHRLFVYEPGGDPVEVASEDVAKKVSFDVVYFDQGNYFLAYESHDTSGQEYQDEGQVGVVNLQTPNSVKYFPKGTALQRPMKVHFIEGVPHFYVWAHTGLYVGNLRTLKYEKLRDLKRFLVPHQFEWKGSRFVTWREAVREIYIREVDSKTEMKIDLPFEAKGYQVFYDKDGMPFGLIERNSGPPMLLRFFREETK